MHALWINAEGKIWNVLLVKTFIIIPKAVFVEGIKFSLPKVWIIHPRSYLSISGFYFSLNVGDGVGI